MRLPLLAAFAMTLFVPFAHASTADIQIRSFKDPIDALSVSLEGATSDAAMSYKEGNSWSEWEPLNIENEQDPLLKESNLVLFPERVTEVRLRGVLATTTLHPLRISSAPVTYKVAATGTTGTPRILTRSEWGADESLRVSTARPTVTPDAHDGPASSSSAASSTSSTGNSRIDECEQAQVDYPEEFQTNKRKKVTKNENGETLRWPQEYSPSVRMIVVHHTAGAVGSDTRSGVERMRAIYQYHAVSNGWGDIGYNFVIDEKGQIYEGRAGGQYVIAGHAYCHNTGTIGISLMGNFDTEEPTQAQIKSLQWLIENQADVYGIDVEKSVRYHGKTFDSPVVGHRDLLSTSCPGFYAYGVLAQVRNHVIQGDVYASVTFPVKPAPEKVSDAPWVDKAMERRIKRGGTAVSSAPAAITYKKEGIFAMGGTTISGRPGEETVLSVRYQNGSKTIQRRKSIGAIKRSTTAVKLWMDKDGVFEALGTQLYTPLQLSPEKEAIIRMKLQFPRDEGTYTLQLGDVVYTLETSGRRARTVTTGTTFQVFNPIPKASAQTMSSSSSSQSRASSSSSSSSRTSASARKNIRIRLSYTSDTPGTATVQTDSRMTINDKTFAAGSVIFTQDGTDCTASKDGKKIASGIVRLDPGSSIVTISSWNRERNRFYGIIECQIVDNTLTLINELPLERYMEGLAEEGDSEPYEKQRAFAIAARSYAMYYMSPNNRKFPGKPYDGSDNPAEFQVYGGVTFQEKNPRWVKVAQETAGKVLTVKGEVIKVPYFSSDDGRTRSPDELGGSFWKNFPNKEIFSSKDDPWCKGMENRGHGVGMSGCGAEGQANEGKTGEEILGYYYPGTRIEKK
jgi:hypothetical protein